MDAGKQEPTMTVGADQFRLLVESVSDYAIFMLEPSGRVATWNKGARNLKGYEAKEIIGSAYERFFLPEDAAAGKPRRLLDRALAEGHVEDEGWRMRKDGTRFWALAVITAIYDGDHLVGFGKVTRDLTERKRAEDQRRQFEMLVKSVTDYAILMLDPTGKISSWNKGAQQLKGYTEREVIGQPMHRFYTPEDLAAHRPEALLAIAEREGHVEDEGWRVRKDGTRFWADVVLTAVREDDGTLVGFAKITRDLTERKLAEDLAARTLQLQIANKLKSELLANISHELRTPLNSIIGYTQLVATDDTLTLDDLNAGNLQIVLRNARHLLALINEVLDLSKIEAGQAVIHLEPVDPAQTLHAVLTTCRPQADEKGIALSLEIEAGVELVVTDETKLRQILLNLVTNAIKFTDQGQVDVRLMQVGETRWGVCVDDTGSGIAPEHRELVFQEFRQVDASHTRRQGGTGLGLAISRKLAGLLEGTLTFESELGRGSSFCLELPRQLGIAAEPALPPLVAAASAGGTNEPIVVAIDDDPEALRLVVENLKGSGFRVVTASSGESGVHLAQTIRPAIITLDVMMPRQDGWMVLRRLKADAATADIPVVMVSFLENRGLAIQLGASESLMKPIDRPALLATLGRFGPKELA
ncbi:MAG: luxQ 10 [Cyanobacteria bacterium RYN_339]|nr:luxQ 10 [Cyanobacteria bacterium RYN_339]